MKRLQNLPKGAKFDFRGESFVVVWNDHSGRAPLVKCLDGGPPCETMSANCEVEVTK